MSRELWLRRLRPAPEAGVRLVCFPYAGGSAVMYRGLADRLWPAVEVLAVQYPGRQDRRREALVHDIGELADRIAPHVPVDADLAFFGHSMGAVVGYEVARRLEREAGVVLRELFASGRRAPSRARPPLRPRDEEEFVAWLITLGGAGAGLLNDPEMRALFLPVLQADHGAIEAYRHSPGPVLNCPITVLTGESDPLTTLAEARDWARHTTAGTEVRVFAGGHFFIESDPQGVADVVLERLTRLRARLADS
ncbi:thioesterase II family protein [Thermomonospora amylolytica]|uniref:thioesterase II family protein n=1 Tax=Thermomonospora amylolytica TaxID=1411117 RepID=UPI000E6CFE13|nr:alpha/beta fold hydrolase [Thermomonospora amylolytica]